MKSYSEYVKEERRKHQKKVDSMKPLDRMDCMNRFDRIIDRNKSNISFYVFISLIKIGLGMMLFSMLLVSMETETAILLTINILIMSKYIAIAGLCMYPVMILETILKTKVRKKQLKELYKKYNL